MRKWNCLIIKKYGLLERLIVKRLQVANLKPTHTTWAMMMSKVTTMSG